MAPKGPLENHRVHATSHHRTHTTSHHRTHTTSHRTLMVLSREQLYSRPTPPQRTHSTESVWPQIVVSQAPVRTFHTLTCVCCVCVT